MSERNRSLLPDHPPRAAYIHVPFCRHRCGYCNFALIADRDDLMEAYLLALEQELSWLENTFQVDTLYLGGGTPSHLPPVLLEQLFQIVLQRFTLADRFEFTMEANPADITPDLVEVMKTYQVNRVSLGVQSFSDRKLAVLERNHNAAVIEQAVDWLQVTIPSIALDLIFAVPDESLEEWDADLRHAMALSPEHISTYGLTFEPGTALERRRQNEEFQLISEENDRKMYEMAIEQLAARGMEHYEVSSFAIPGKRSRHNETYWSGRSYFGAGPGAARYVNGRRETNHRSTVGYLRRVKVGQSTVVEQEQLEPSDRARELLVFGLRRLAGVDCDQFAEQTGFSVEELAGPAIQRLVGLKLLEVAGKQLCLSREGLFVSDSIWPELL
ncbi:MAG: radical SAM family heme chaperone HemW [Pirellulaceae bacterium]